MKSVTVKLRIQITPHLIRHPGDKDYPAWNSFATIGRIRTPSPNTPNTVWVNELIHIKSILI